MLADVLSRELAVASLAFVRFLLAGAEGHVRDESSGGMIPRTASYRRVLAFRAFCSENSSCRYVLRISAFLASACNGN